MSDYKDYDSIRRARKDIPHNVRIAYFLHKRLVKPNRPTLHHCDNCGRPIFESNSDTIEIENSFGLPLQSLKAGDSWIRIKCHSCAAKISILWK